MKRMPGQHFLLSAQARTLSLKQVMRMSDNEAFETMKKLRWEGGEPICPACLCTKSYFLSTRKLWKCVSCCKQFSVTSGTIFAHHKLPLQDYLAAVAIFANSAKGHSALQLSRELDVQYKTAFVLSHKIREALEVQQDVTPLQGSIEMDGAYFGGYVKPKNVVFDRVDRRKKEYRAQDRLCVMVLRERGLAGAARTKTFICNKESAPPLRANVPSMVAKGSTLYTDHHSSYQVLDSQYTHVKVNHEIEYSNKTTGACTNQAESYFARLRRAQIGQHHRLSNKHLSAYATEMAYREDMRRKSNGVIFNDISSKALRSRESKSWKGYWQKISR